MRSVLSSGAQDSTLPSTLSNSSLTYLSTYSSIKTPALVSERPDLNPLPLQFNNDGPKYFPQLKQHNGVIKIFPDPYQGKDFCSRDAPVIDQGVYRQGREVQQISPESQWVLSPNHSTVSSIGPQILSNRISGRKTGFQERPETCPTIKPNNLYGPGRYDIDRNMITSAKANQGSVSLHFTAAREVIDPILNDALNQQSVNTNISSNFLDASSVTTDLSFIPPKSIGKQILSQKRSYLATPIGTRREVFPIAKQINDIGPAKYNHPSLDFNFRNFTPKDKSRGISISGRFGDGNHISPTSTLTSSASTSSFIENSGKPPRRALYTSGRLYSASSTSKLPSLRLWLDSQIHQDSLFNSKLDELSRVRGASSFSTDREVVDPSQSEYPQDSDLSLWLKTHGGASKLARSAMVSRYPRNRWRGGASPAVQPTSRAVKNIRSRAGMEMNAARLLQERSAALAVGGE